MRLTRIAVVALLGIVLVSTVACSFNSHQGGPTPTHTTTATATLTPASASTPTPTSITTPTPEATPTSTLMPGPTLISPSDGTTAAGTVDQGTSTASVSLIWENIPEADEYEYQVAYDTGFGSIATAGTIENTQVDTDLFLGVGYYWRVRGYNPAVSQWSDVWSFTTPLGPASAKPVITYPGSQENHNDIELTPTLTWTSTIEATGFELVVAKNCDWSNPVIGLTGFSALGPDTCYAITQALQKSTNYCWKVRAINTNSGITSPWSDTATFTTIY